MPKAKTPRFEMIGELRADLGGISGDRVRLSPTPGTATRRDLLRLHGRGSKLYELIDGTLVEKPMGSPESFVAVELIWRLRNYLEHNTVGFLYAPDSLVELLPRLVSGPDVCFVSWQTLPDRKVPSDRISKQVPELVVEVLSRGSTRGEIARKLKEFFLAGVRLVWTIDPGRGTAAAYTAPDVKAVIPARGSLDAGDVLPGFSAPLTALLEPLAPFPAKPKRKR